MKRLKDKDLQKQLDKLSDGSFSEELAKVVIKLHDDSGIPLMKVEFGPVVGKSMTRRFALVFEKGDIEDAQDYNPKTWNKYPEYWPPKTGFYFICVQPGGKRFVQLSYFDGLRFECEFQGMRGIVAWMPVKCPKPYYGPDTIDMHPDAIAARRYMENHHA